MQKKQSRHPKYIFVVGGVMSSVGKGVTTSSIALVMKSKGYSVTALKADPYINVDAGTMNPTEHGEVFVTDDGDETDQDIGNYERFLDVPITSVNYFTTGRVYQTVIRRERNLEYNGKCVEVVPHVPEEIIRRIQRAQKVSQADITIVEVGGTVGEYQNILFLEAARMMKLMHPNDVAFVLVSYLPIPRNVGEMKTKPTQYASRSLNNAGIQTNFIVCRGEKPLDNPRRERLAVFCGISKDHAISAPDAASIYDVPLLFEREKFGDKISKELQLPARQSKLHEWQKLSRAIHSLSQPVRIGVVGKYFGTGNFTLADSYISVIEAVKHAAWHHHRKPEMAWIDSEEYERDPRKANNLRGYDGIIVPGGFGTRGIEGVMRAIRFVREHDIPYFGLCYGMQLACIEFMRTVLKKSEANTTEIDPKTPYPVIIANPYQRQNIKDKRMGGTMRLGAYPCALTKGSRAHAAYKTLRISERHRHRYEFNNEYQEMMKKEGMRFTGICPTNNLVEIIELKDHPWFVGTQFHPEFLSRPLRPHPLFREFIAAAIRRK